MCSTTPVMVLFPFRGSFFRFSIRFEQTLAVGTDITTLDVSVSTTTCCVRVRPYPYIQCYTSVICRFHTLRHRCPQLSTGCEWQSCSSTTCGNGAGGLVGFDYSACFRAGYPLVSTEEIFACGCVTAGGNTSSRHRHAAPAP